MAAIKKIYGLLLDLIFPQKAEVKEIEEMLPAELYARAKKASGNEFLLRNDIFPLFAYRDPLITTAIWELKYRGNRKIAALLASLLYDEIISHLENEEMFSNFTWPILVPIPLSKKRRRKRGFNQIELLLGEMKKIDTNMVFEFSNDILFKTRETLPQTMMKDRRLRLMNLNGCFEARNLNHLSGRNVILVDDVATTGSTLLEAKKTLLQAGAKKVLAFTLSH